MQASWLRDVHYAWRSVSATPRLTLTASASAALGLGAAIFMTTLVKAVLLSAPAIPEPDRLVRVWTTSTTTHDESDLSYPEVLDVGARTQSFERVEAASRTRLALSTDAGTERVRGESVTPGYFALIGVRPALGRLFSASEYAPDAARPVIIGYQLWQRRFGGRPDVLGQPFRTRPTSRQSPDSVRTIVGVMPEGFVGTVDPDQSEFWLPIAHYEPAAILSNRQARSTWLLGRLKPGTSLAAAQDEIAALGTALAAEHPAAYDRLTLSAEPFGESWRERFRLSLYTLLGAAALLLLIACTDIATLLMARLAEREGELRVRLALGAPRARIVGQLLAESLLIAVAGGAAGLLLAATALRATTAAGVFELPAYVTLGVDSTTLAACAGLIVVTGLVFGVLPARIGAGASLVPASGTRVSAGMRQRRYGRVLVVGQVALTFVLLASAVLLARTYRALVGGDLGYRTTHLLRMAVTPDPNVFATAAARLALADDIKRTFDAHPGVERSAILAGVLPPWFDDAVDLDLGAGERLRDVGRHAVGPDFFEAMGMRVTGGRAFGPSDRAPGATSALASESLARRLTASNGRGAVGQRVRIARGGDADAAVVDIVGVVNDVVYNGPLRPRPADYDLYFPLESGAAGPLSIAVQTAGDPGRLTEELVRELGRLAPSSPQHWISTMEAELDLQYRDAKLYAMLSGIFGAVAALLSILGIYGVIANGVARRHRELGVRMAVGARAGDIIRLILAEGARTLAIGVAIGAMLTLGLGRVVAGLLYGVAPSDPVTFVGVAAALLAVGLVACFVPSLRASRLDPLKALRT